MHKYFTKQLCKLVNVIYALACLTHSGYTKCENDCAFAKTKPQLIITTALHQN